MGRESEPSGRLVHLCGPLARVSGPDAEGLAAGSGSRSRPAGNFGAGWGGGQMAARGDPPAPLLPRRRQILSVRGAPRGAAMLASSPGTRAAGGGGYSSRGVRTDVQGSGVAWGRARPWGVWRERTTLGAGVGLGRVRLPHPRF